MRSRSPTFLMLPSLHSCESTVESAFSSPANLHFSKISGRVSGSFEPASVSRISSLSVVAMSSSLNRQPELDLKAEHAGVVGEARHVKHVHAEAPALEREPGRGHREEFPVVPAVAVDQPADEPEARGADAQRRPGGAGVGAAAIEAVLVA